MKKKSVYYYLYGDIVSWWYRIVYNSYVVDVVLWLRVFAAAYIIG